MNLPKRIIPCLDIDQGRVVKGVKFLDIVDAGDPVAVAENYNQQGADELVLLDIGASHQQRDTMISVVEAVAERIFIPFTVGGGIRSLADIKSMLRAGADKVSINTAAIKDPELISRAAQAFGSQCIVVAIDAKQVEDKKQGDKTSKKTWRVFTHGGRNDTGIDAVEWAERVVRLGAGEILLTSMDADGTKSGYDVALTKAIADAVAVPLIASGGVGTLAHLADGIIEGRADAVLAASIFHFAEYSIQDAKDYLKSCGILVRAN